MKTRNFAFLSALVAALLVGFTSSTSFAQEPPAEEATEEDPPPTEEVTEDADQTDQSATDQADQPAADQTDQPAADTEEDQPAAEDDSAEDDSADEATDSQCEKDKKDLQQQRDGAYALMSEKKSSGTEEHNAGWHWGAGGKLGLIPNGEKQSGLTQVYGLGRWQSSGPFGVEALLGLGVWPTSKAGTGSAPFAASAQIAGLLELFKEGGVFLGMEVSRMRTPSKEKSGSGLTSKLSLLAGMHVIVNNVQVRLGVGPGYSPFERLNGWMMSMEVGRYF